MTWRTKTSVVAENFALHAKLAEVSARLAQAERLISDLYWHDWSAEREAEVRAFLGVLPDGPRNDLVSKGGKMRLKQYKGRIYTPESDT